MAAVRNLFAASPGSPGVESIDTLVESPAFSLEHIVSRGAPSPEGFWYDQPRDEWVLLLRGEAEIRYESGEVVAMMAGDSLSIAAHCRHRVDRTSGDAIWLALHFDR